MIRRFKLAYDYWSAVVEIDEEKAADDLKEVVEFWMDWQRALARNKGDYAKTFVEQLGPLLLEKSMNNSLTGVQQEMSREEGFVMALDGSNDITLISLDEYQLGYDEIEVTEIKRKDPTSISKT